MNRFGAITNFLSRLLSLILLTSIFVVAFTMSRVEAASFADLNRDSNTDYTLDYVIDRSQVPTLFYNDLTLKVRVNQISSAQVIANNRTISHTYDAAIGQLIFTTSANTVTVVINDVTDTQGLGEVVKAVLKDDKGFAWSHGMDDNHNLMPQVDVFEEHDWQATLFLIGNMCY